MVGKSREGIREGLTAAGLMLREQIYNSLVSGYGDPIWDTGATIQSLDIDPVSDGDTSVHVGVATNYAPYVHDGTYKMVARPFVGDVMKDPLVQQAAKEVIE